MLQACRASLARRLVTNSLAASYRQVSSDCGDSKVYELRKYSLKPNGVGQFLSLMKENYDERLKHSKLFGFWMADLGALNQAIHIWEYDNYEHRTRVRAALAEDGPWQENFVSKAFAHLDKQENSVIFKANWCDLDTCDRNTGVFELVTYGMKIGGPSVWGDKLKSSLLAHARLHYADLGGVWYTEIGDHNDVNVLWRYESMDARREGRKRAHKDAVVVNKVRDNLENVQRQSCVIMNPLPFLKV